MSFIPPTDEETAMVLKLRQRLQQEAPHIVHTYSDTSILRFYRGRKNVEDKALNALIKHVEWRKENNVDAIATNATAFEKELSSGKIALQGFDKTGRPAVFIYAAKHNKNNRDLEELRQLIIFTMERVLEMAKPDEERMVIVFDLSGFGLSCMDYDALKVLVNILSYNYPETLSVSYVVNAPFMFWGCWGLIKPWLDPVTAAKVQFVKKDALSAFFDGNVLATPIPQTQAEMEIKKSVTSGTEMNSVASDSAADLPSLEKETITLTATTTAEKVPSVVAVGAESKEATT